MGRAPCCDKAKVKKGPWSPEEDATLKSHIQLHGTGGNWISLPNKIGLKRCGKSCRLRWLNYLRPNIKHGGFTEDEDNLICTLYTAIGSRWSIMAAQLPGRTDNDIKNYWNTKLKKKLLSKQFDDHPLLIMDQPEPVFFHSVPQQNILEAANINVWEINSAFQVMNINHYSSINLEAEGIMHAANAVPQLHISSSSSSSSSSSLENVTPSTYNSLIYQPQPNYQLWTSIFDDPSYSYPTSLFTIKPSLSACLHHKQQAKGFCFCYLPIS